MTIDEAIGRYYLIGGQAYEVAPSDARNRVLLTRDGGRNGYEARVSDGGVMLSGRQLEPATAVQGAAMRAEHADRCRRSDLECADLLARERAPMRGPDYEASILARQGRECGETDSY